MLVFSFVESLAAVYAERFLSGVFAAAVASDFALMLIVIGAVSASAGILSPILTYWISARAGSAQGWELGKQTAAASLGVTLGSAAGGLLFNIAALPGASFLLTAGLAVLGVLLSFGLPQLLVPAISGTGGSRAGRRDRGTSVKENIMRAENELPE